MYSKILKYIQGQITENQRKLDLETDQLWSSFYLGRYTESKQTYLALIEMLEEGVSSNDKG